MATVQELLDRIEARDPWTIIQELGRMRMRRKRGEPIEVPLATFHLRGGRDVSGFVLDLRGSGSDWSLLVQAPSSGGGQASDVTYLDPRGVEAITVHDALRSIEALSFGAIERGDEIPTAIAIRRRLEELQRELSGLIGEAVAVAVDWDAIPAEDAVVLSVSRAIDAIEGAVRDVVSASDPADLRGCFASIRLVPASAPGVTAADGVLVISAALDQGRPGRFDRDALRKAIEAVL